MESSVPHLSFGLLSAPPINSVTSEATLQCRIGTRSSFAHLAPTDKGFILRFPELADFVIDIADRRIDAWEAAPGNPETLRHLLLDQVLPRLLAQQGQLVLHAGAVRVGGEAIAFVGDTGCGKSTLTGFFHESGFSLLSDDGLVLSLAESCTLALATYPSLRLWPDALGNLYRETRKFAPMNHYSTKKRVVLEGDGKAASLPIPLAALFVLGAAPQAGDDSVSLYRISPRDACMAIICNAFQLDPTDIRRAADLLDAATVVAHRTPAFMLCYPREFSRLPGVQAAILHQLQGGTAC